MTWAKSLEIIFFYPTSNKKFFERAKIKLRACQIKKNPSSGSEVIIWIIKLRQKKPENHVIAAEGCTDGAAPTKFWLKKLKGGIKHTHLSKIS